MHFVETSGLKSNNKTTNWIGKTHTHKYLSMYKFIPVMALNFCSF